MKKYLLLTTALLMSGVAFAASGARITQDVNQGTDCELFLKPFIETELKDVSGQIVLDAGCGLAPNAMLAAKNGANVCAFETKKHLLEQALSLVQKTGLESQIAFCLGEPDELPYSSNSFDRTLCINSEINLREIGRVMKDGGRLMIAAPASYGVVFSDGSRAEEAVLQHIEHVLNKMGKNPEPAAIVRNLSELDEVMRATFVKSEGGVRLVTNEKELKIGQQIWCKIPGSVISGIYHSEEECLIAITSAGLVCEEIKRPCFFGNVKYNMWRENQEQTGKSLGTAYVNNHPFTIYYVMKPS